MPPKAPELSMTLTPGTADAAAHYRCPSLSAIGRNVEIMQEITGLWHGGRTIDEIRAALAERFDPPPSRSAIGRFVRSYKDQLARLNPHEPKRQLRGP